MLKVRVCVPGIYSDYQQQIKDSNFDELYTPKVVAMATTRRKNNQNFTILHLFKAISQVNVGNFFFKLGILTDTALKNSLREK